MHRQLLGLIFVDHINGDRLDNRRENLRPATQEENSRNRKTPASNAIGYKGVSFDAGRNSPKKYRALIKPPGVRQKTIGYFLTAEEAARAYNEAAKRYFGEFARMNEIPGEPKDEQ